MKTILTILLLAIMSTQAKADYYGSMCVDRGPIQQCTFWIYYSESKTMFKRSVSRDGE